MGTGTRSGKTATSTPTAPRQTIAQSLGITDDELNTRSQNAINSLTQGRLRNAETRQQTVANAETNTIYDLELSKDLMEGRGFVLAVRKYVGSPNATGGRTPQRIVNYEHFDNATQVKNAIYDATGIPKPSRRGQ